MEASAASRIPSEIIREIVSYLSDIDVRRAFDVRPNRLTVQAHVLRGLSTRLMLHEHMYMGSRAVPSCVYTARYELPNACHAPRRRVQFVDNDMIERKICINADNVHCFVFICRLKRKDGTRGIEDADRQMYHKGDLEEYFWDYLHFDYSY